MNLTNYMDLFKDYFDNLTLFYYDLGVIRTIHGIQEKIQNSQNIYTTDESGIGAID